MQKGGFTGTIKNQKRVSCLVTSPFSSFCECLRMFANVCTLIIFWPKWATLAKVGCPQFRSDRPRPHPIKTWQAQVQENQAVRHPALNMMTPILMRSPMRMGVI